jgi:predicted trehalose synthase
MTALSELLDANDPVLQRDLTRWLPARRWFRSKSKTLSSVTVEAHAPVGEADETGEPPRFCILETVFSDGAFERYALPLTLFTPAEAASLPEAARIAFVQDGNGEKILGDASWDPRFRAGLFELLTQGFGGKRETRLGRGLLRVNASDAPADRAHGENGESTPASRILAAEQSNTAFAYEPPGGRDAGGGSFVKLYRRLEEAVNPEPEVLRFLGARAEEARVPRFLGGLDWVEEGRVPVTLALMQDLVDTRGDAWEYTLGNLRQPDFPAWISRLGRHVAELHNALASRPDVPDFAPEPLASEDLGHLRAGTRALLDGALASLSRWTGPAETEALARRVLDARARLEALLDDAVAAVAAAPAAVKTRTHGDLHLGQVLVGARDPDQIWILDFEGEPGRPLAEARRKHSPLRDAAGMLRSFHYAAHTGLREAGPDAADALAAALRAAFLDGYGRAQRAAGVDRESPAFARLLDLFTLEKAIYELHYELNNRPDWVVIPLRGLLALSAPDSGKTGA